MKLNKKQKRTATIASMAALLAVVLGMGGQTFAKYITTTETGTVQATVAKWGYVINANATGMFKNSYETETTPAPNGADGVSVKATNAKVAPGTSGSMTITVTGVSEVDATVSFTTGDTEWQDVKLTDNIAVDKTTGYNPVLWTLTGEDSTIKNASLADVENYFKTKTFHFEAEDYNSAQNASKVNISYTLSWAWAFEKGNEDHNKHINDYYDTLLGRAGTATQVNSEKIGTVDHTYSYVTEINFSLGVTVAQVD